MTRYIENLKQFLNEVAGGYRLLVPRQRAEGWFFEPYGDGQVQLEDYPNTVSSPKEYLFPQTETLYQYHSGEAGLEYENRIPEQTRQVIFGARPCDCAGVTRLDQVFLEDSRDPYYAVRRENTLIIGLVCPGAVGPNCFCTEVGLSPAGSEGMDLRATEVGQGLVIEEASDRGAALFDSPSLKNSKSWREATEEEAAEAKRVQEKAVEEMAPERDLAGVEMEFDAPIWAQEAEYCIGCGICSFLGPTCHCFTIEHSGSKKMGKAIRTWDTCQFQDYSLEASGFNPRPDRLQRLKQRLYHKFKYFNDRYGMLLCVGCGRCVSSCPVNIDIRRILAAFERKKSVAS
jgi:sulfhydrogenase subunit beta (sulfur reductase)